MVAGLQLCVTLHQIAHTIAHKSRQGHLLGHSQVLNGRLGHFRTFFHHHLGHFGISKGKTLGIGVVAIEQRLEYLARCKQFFIIVFKLGIAGAAIATVISQAVCAVIVVYALMFG